jgi:threonine dehydrogenase-like Zn-dependent dehydrogenase
VKSVRLRLTHICYAGASGVRPPDALAVDPDSGQRVFVPGWLPCGECGRCRRGWVAACERGQALVGPPAGPSVVDANDRFLTPLEDLSTAPLPEPVAACAGAVAEVAELAARSGLGAGDVAVWIGDDVRCALGARLSATRGCATFLLTSSELPPRNAVNQLRLSAAPTSWSAALEAAAAAAPGGFQERRLFVARPTPLLVDAALALAAPGATLAFLESVGSAAVSPGALASCRMIVAAGRGYHPDLVPEALASLRRDPTLTDGLLEAATPGTAPREDRLISIALD